MFRKIVTNALLSPSAISELGAYAARLNRMEKRRRIGLIFISLALIVQLFTAFTPTSSSNSANAADLLYGGFSTKQALLQRYDSNEQSIREIYEDLGIHHDNILAATDGTYNSQSDDFITTRAVPFGSNQNSHTVELETTSYQTTPARNFDTSRLSLRQGTSYHALIGTNANQETFAVLYDSGNVVLEKSPHAPCDDTANSENDCSATITYKLSVHNDTHKNPGPTLTGSESDKLTYTITATNDSDVPAEATLQANVHDALEYGSLIATDGGTLDDKKRFLQWPNATIPPHESIQKTYTLRLNPTFAATAQGSSNPLSYDCVITQSQDNITTVRLQCPLAKQAELFAKELPTTHRSLATGFSVFIFVLAFFLYFRVRTLQHEIRLLRKEINTGALS